MSDAVSISGRTARHSRCLTSNATILHASQFRRYNKSFAKPGRNPAFRWTKIQSFRKNDIPVKRKYLRVIVLLADLAPGSFEIIIFAEEG